MIQSTTISCVCRVWPIYTHAICRHTYTAQLFSHDVNHDDMSQLGQTIDPSTIVNKNTPSVDLDCVYSMNVRLVLK